MKKIFALILLMGLAIVNCPAPIYYNYFTTNAVPSVGGATNGIQQVGGAGTNTTLADLSVVSVLTPWPGNITGGGSNNSFTNFSLRIINPADSTGIKASRLGSGLYWSTLDDKPLFGLTPSGITGHTNVISGSGAQFIGNGAGLTNLNGTNITAKTVNTNNLSDAAYVALVGGGTGSVTITNNTDAVGIVTGSGSSYGIGTNQAGISGGSASNTFFKVSDNANIWTNVFGGSYEFQSGAVRLQPGTNVNAWINTGDGSYSSFVGGMWIDNYGASAETFHLGGVPGDATAGSFVLGSGSIVDLTVTGTLNAATQNITTLTVSNSSWTGVATMTNAANAIAGVLTNAGGTASTFAVHDANKKLISTAASSVLATTLTDETGTGVAVFGTAPTFTTSIETPQTLYTTNSGSAVSPNMAVGYSLLSTNAAFAMLLPTGVDTTQTKVQTSVLLVTNSLATATAITPPAAPCKSLGTWYMTNVSSITVTVYPKVVTNYICLPIF